MNETQRNWKKTFKEYEPTEYDKIYRQPRRHLKVRRERSAITTFLLMIVATVGISYITKLSDHLFVDPNQAVMETNAESAVKQIDANRNGIVMKKSIERLEEIFETIDQNVNTLKREQLTEYIREVKALDLSEEYDTLKEQSIKKIKKAKECVGALQNKESEKAIKKINKLIGEYNNMKLYEYMKEAFDQAGVEYTLKDDGTIGYYKYYK